MSAIPVTALIHYRAQPEKADIALAELASLIATVISRESECLGIRLYRDPADAERLLLYERWSDGEYYTGPHMETPHLQSFIARSGEFLAGPPDITLWQLQREETRQSLSDGSLPESP